GCFRPCVPEHAGSGRGEVFGTAGEEPEFEFLRRALGTFDKRGVPVETDFVRGEFAAPCGFQLSPPLSPRTKPSGQGQSAAVPDWRECSSNPADRRSLLRAARRPCSSTTTTAPHEYLDCRGSSKSCRRRARPGSGRTWNG